MARKINDTRHLKQNNDIIICRKTLGHFVVVVVKKAGSHTESVYSKMYCGYGASLQQDVLWLSSQFTTRCTVVMEPVCSKMYCDNKYCSFFSLLQPRINVCVSFPNVLGICALCVCMCVCVGGGGG